MAKAAPKSNVFGSAPIITATKPSSKSTATEIVIPEIDNVAALKAVIDALTAVLVEESRVVKEKMNVHFVTNGLALKRQPGNFKAVGMIGSASCQLRATSAPLNPEGVLLCKEHGITTKTTAKIADTFIFAPAYANDSDFVRKMEVLIGPQLNELADARGPVILKQDGQDTVNVTDVGRNEVFTKPEEVVRALMPVVFTPAIRAKLETNGDLKPAITLVQKLFGSPLFQEAAAAAASEKKSKKAAA